MGLEHIDPEQQEQQRIQVPLTDLPSSHNEWPPDPVKCRLYLTAF